MTEISSSHELVTKKIGFVLYHNSTSGGVNVVFQHARTLNELGHDVIIIFVSDAFGLSLQSPIKSALLADIVARAVRFDILIATWWETFFSMFAVESEKYLYLCQSDDRRLYPSRACREYDFIEGTYRAEGVGYLVVARWMCDWLADEFGIKAECAPNGIDTSLFHRDVEPLVPKGKRVRVLIEGNGSAFFKRVSLAFRVANRFPDIEVWYVSGDGYTEGTWRYDRMFAKLHLTEMPAVYASCDILLKLSSIDSFSFPPLEMMACGGTAVLSRFSGAREYARDGENALLVDIDDEEGAAAALDLLIRDGELRKRLAAEGMRTAGQFSWDVKAPQFLAALDRLVEHAGTVRPAERNRLILVGHLNEAFREIRGLRAQVRLQSSPFFPILRVIDILSRRIRKFFARIIRGFEKPTDT